MLSQLLLVITFIGAAMAQLPAIAQRDFIENRQLASLSINPTCQSVLNSISTIYAGAPTPPANLPISTITDPCVAPSFTGSLQSEWQSYETAALQWFTSHSSDFSSLKTACSDILQSVSMPFCSSALGELGGLPTAATTASAQTTGTAEHGSSHATAHATESHASSSHSPSSSTSSGGIAPRETGFVVAAAAVAAGFMGAVAVL
ncbi:hypothetical protein ANO14919_001580 [Xylariales sp. No.14919]|nr:hypothetical protein ANO14919_001580 [Xylariales sp. No.14919]